MKTFQIWSEGYVITGNSADAQLWGEAAGADFKDACVNYAAANPEFAKRFNPERMTHWGCRLFDNEAAARKAFG